MCCRSALTRILDLEGHGAEARRLDALADGPDETFDFQSKVQDVAGTVADNLDLPPAEAPQVATSILDVLDGPPDQWGFAEARHLILQRTGTDISDLAPLWDGILERAHA